MRIFLQIGHSSHKIYQKAEDFVLTIAIQISLIELSREFSVFEAVAICVLRRTEAGGQYSDGSGNFEGSSNFHFPVRNSDAR